MRELSLSIPDLKKKKNFHLTIILHWTCSCISMITDGAKGDMTGTTHHDDSFLVTCPPDMSSRCNKISRVCASVSLYNLNECQNVFLAMILTSGTAPNKFRAFTALSKYQYMKFSPQQGNRGIFHQGYPTCNEFWLLGVLGVRVQSRLKSGIYITTNTVQQGKFSCRKNNQFHKIISRDFHKIISRDL